MVGRSAPAADPCSHQGRAAQRACASFNPSSGESAGFGCLGGFSLEDGLQELMGERNLKERGVGWPSGLMGSILEKHGPTDTGGNMDYK
jgi:hypothetical protein